MTPNPRPKRRYFPPKAYRSVQLAARWVYVPFVIAVLWILPLFIFKNARHMLHWTVPYAVVIIGLACLPFLWFVGKYYWHYFRQE